MIPEKPNLKIGRRKATEDEVELAKAALLDMAPLEAGYFLRDLKLNFPVTMDAIRRAKESMGTIIKTITNKSDMITLGTCPRPGGAGFSKDKFEEAVKLEVISCGHGIRPFTRYCLRGKNNRLLAQSRVRGQYT